MCVFWWLSERPAIQVGRFIQMPVVMGWNSFFCFKKEQKGVTPWFHPLTVSLPGNLFLGQPHPVAAAIRDGGPSRPPSQTLGALD